MTQMTPREIVSELDRFIVGQRNAKRAVAIALRNRWRRLAKLAQAPFIKVEASKFTEVGYVGRDVESMIRDLTELAINMVREEERGKVQTRARGRAEERVLDLLLPSPTPDHRIQP